MPLPTPEEVFGSGNAIPPPSDILGGPDIQIDNTELNKQKVALENASQIIDNIPNISAYQKNLVKDLTQKGAKPEQLSQAIQGFQKQNEKDIHVWSDKPRANYLNYITNAVAVGSDMAGAAATAFPAMLNDVISMPFNYVASGRFKEDLQPLPNVPESMRDEFGLNENPFTSKGIAEYTGLDKVKLPDAISNEFYNKDIKARQEEMLTRYDKTIEEYIAEGDYSKALGAIGGGVAQSLPITASLMMGNAAGLTGVGSTALGAVGFAGLKKQELDESAPHMSEQDKMKNALLSGSLEMLIEKWGITKLGGITKDILLREGKEEAKKIALDGFKKIYLPVVTKIVGPTAAEEVIGEGATQVLQNVTDKYIGDKPARPDIDLSEGVVDAMSTAAGSALGFSALPAIAEVKANKRANKYAEIIQQEDKIAKENTKSEHAFNVANQGEETVLAFESNVDNAMANGNLTLEEGEKAKHRVRAYKEYIDQLADVKIDDEIKRKVSDLSYQKQGLQSEIPEDVVEKDLSPIELGKRNAKQAQIKGLQKEIDALILNGQVKDEVIVSKDTEKKVEKTEEEMTEREKKMKEKAANYKAEGIPYLPKEVVEDKIKKGELPLLEETAPNQFNEKKYNPRNKFKQIVEKLSRKGEPRIAKGNIKVIDTEVPKLDETGKQVYKNGKLQLVKGTVLEIELESGHRIRMSSSMERGKGGFRGHFKEEFVFGDKELTENQKRKILENYRVGIEAVKTTQGHNNEDSAIKVFSAKTGKVLGWAKATTHGENPLTFDIISKGEKDAGKKGITQAEYKGEEARQDELADMETKLNEPLDDENLPPTDTTTKPPVKPIIPTNEKTTDEGTGQKTEDTKKESKGVGEKTQPKTEKEVEEPKIAEDDAETELAESKLSKEDNAEQEPAIKIIESKADSDNQKQRDESISEATKIIDSATDVVNLSVSELSTDEDRFQNRDELDKDIVKQIAENFDENQFDPIVVWKQGDKTFVLAGHHRFEGAKQAGKTSVKVRYFNGTEAQAIEFAREKSNANRTMENPVERAKIYRDKLAKGETKKSVEEQAKQNEGKNASFYLNIAALNPDGIAIETYNRFKGSEDRAAQKEVEKILDWIGEVRRSYPELTNQHEQELFNFLFDKETSKRITTKADFKQKVTTIVGGFDFDANKPLNIARFKYKSEGEKVYDQEVEGLKTKIGEIQTQIDELKDRFVNPKNPKYIKPDNKDYAEVKKLADEKIAKLNAEQQKLNADLLDIYKKKGEYVDKGSNQGELFQKQKQKAAKGNLEVKHHERIQKIAKHIQKVLPKVKVVYNSKLEAAGRLKGNTLEINPYYATEDTPIHEAAHVLLDAIGHNNKVIQAALKQIKASPKGKKMWEAVQRDYSELSVEGQENELLAEAIGLEGKGIFDTEIEKSRFKTFLDYIFDWFKRKLGLEKNIAKSLARQIIGGRGLGKLEGISGKSKEQIVGEKAKLKKEVVENRRKAEIMEAIGEDADKIRLMTGWERGKDKIWRYELGDENARVKLTNLLLNTLKIADENHLDGAGNLSDILSYKELYRAYPELKNVKIRIYYGKGNEQGRFNKKNNAIEINARKVQEQHPNLHKEMGGGRSEYVHSLREFLFHETQHIIQAKEGFAEGGNYSLAEKLLNDKYHDKAVKEFEKVKKEGVPGITFEDVLADVIFASEAIHPNESWESIWHRTYKKIAGEVEARNVALRSNLSDEEKKLISLQDTEDTYRYEQIITRGSELSESKELKTLEDIIQRTDIDLEELGDEDKYDTETVGDENDATKRLEAGEILYTQHEQSEEPIAVTDFGQYKLAKEAGYGDWMAAIPLGDAKYQKAKKPFERTADDEVQTLAEFRKDQWDRDIEKENEDIEYANEIIKDKNSTPDELREAKGLKENILNRIREDKQQYANYLSEVKTANDFLKDDGLEDYSYEELLDIYNNSHYSMDNESPLHKAVKLRIALNLESRQKEILEKNPNFDPNKKFKDMGWAEKFTKSITDISEKFPALQHLSKILQNAFIEREQTKRQMSEKLTSLAKKVINERNRKLGVVKEIGKELFTSNTRRYFEYLDNGKGQLITKEEGEKIGLTKAQMDYRDYMQELVDLRNAQYDENDNLIANDLMKVDMGFQEAVKEGGGFGKASGWLSGINSYLSRGIDPETNIGDKEYQDLQKEILDSKDTGFIKKVFQLKRLRKEGYNYSDGTNYINYGGGLTLKSDRPRPKDKAYSKDYHNAAMQMINNYAHVKHVGPIVPLFNSVLYFYEHSGMMAGKAPNLVKFIQNEINDKINQNGVKTFQKADSVLRFLRKQGSLATMGFAWKANLMNIGYGLYTNWKEEGAGHRIKGNLRLSKNPKKAMDILKFADVVKVDTDIDPQIKAGRGFVKLAFLFNKLGEMHISSSQFMGYLTPQDWNSFEKTKDGYKLKEGVDKDAILKRFASYKNKVSNIQGKYDEVYRRSFERGEIGGAVSQYKKWIADWWKSRFGQEMINEFGESVRGSYMMFGKEAVKELKNDFSKENNYGIEISNGLPRIKNKQVAQNLRESMAVAAILIAMNAGDDEDKKSKRFHNALSLESALGNMLFIFDPDQAQYIIEHPAGAIGITSQYLKALSALLGGDVKKAKKEAWKITPYRKIVDIAVDKQKK